jgi:SSS family solute:Na+ symporter
MAITGAIYFTGAFAVLVGGIYWKGGSRIGAYGAFLVSLLNIVALAPMQKLLGVKWPGNGEWPGLVIVPATIVVYVLLSVLFPDRRTEES